MRSLIAVALTALLLAVLTAPFANALALRHGSWQALGNKLRALLHTTHMDIDVSPSRADRRRMGIGERLWMVAQSEAGAVTLAQAKLNATDDVDVQAIDEFRKSSWLMDNIAFDDVVSGTGNGATMTYTYTRVVTQPTAQTRAVNAEYTPQEATKARTSADLKIFGGAYDIDRVLALIGGSVNAGEVAFQMEQKIKAAKALWNDLFFNGDSAVNANEFDGLDKMLTGTTTEFRPADVTDWTGINSEQAAFNELEALDEFLGSLDEAPDFLAGNKKLIAKLKGLARRAGYLTKSEDAFGRTVEAYNGVVFLDPGDKAGSTNPVIPIETRDLDAGGPGAAVTGLTDLYAGRLGLDGIHGISLAGAPLVRTWLPDFTTAGAVKKGEVEMVAAVVLKKTKAAAVFRNIKVQ